MSPSPDRVLIVGGVGAKDSVEEISVAIPRISTMYINSYGVM